MSLFKESKKDKLLMRFLVEFLTLFLFSPFFSLEFISPAMKIQSKQIFDQNMVLEDLPEYFKKIYCYLKQGNNNRISKNFYFKLDIFFYA